MPRSSSGYPLPTDPRAWFKQQLAALRAAMREIRALAQDAQRRVGVIEAQQSVQLLDMDKGTRTGSYWSTDAANQPEPGIMAWRVQKTATRTIQEGVKVDLTATSRVRTFRRVLAAGSWSAWTVTDEQIWALRLQPSQTPMSSGVWTVIPVSQLVAGNGMSYASGGVVIPSTGVYSIAAQLGVQSNSTNRRLLRIRKNGIADPFVQVEVATPPSNAAVVSGAWQGQLDEGDVILLEGYQNSGTTLASSSAHNATFMSIVKQF